MGIKLPLFLIFEISTMIKAFLQIILTIVLGYVAQLYFPFWSMAVVAGLVALLFKYENSLAAFSAGFLAAFLLWCAYAYTLDLENLHLLTSKLGELFKIGSSYLSYVTGFIGGLLGGFGAMTGALARKLF
ncbi:MAG: hypothetical protein R2825_02940 [Saprospiraceae bacterium]